MFWIKCKSGHACMQLFGSLGGSYRSLTVKTNPIQLSTRIVRWNSRRLARTQNRMVTTLRSHLFGLMIPWKNLLVKETVVSQFNPGTHCLQHPASKRINDSSTSEVFPKITKNFFFLLIHFYLNFIHYGSQKTVIFVLEEQSIQNPCWK